MAYFWALSQTTFDERHIVLSHLVDKEEWALLSTPSKVIINLIIRNAYYMTFRHQTHSRPIYLSMCILFLHLFFPSFFSSFHFRLRTIHMGHDSSIPIFKAGFWPYFLFGCSEFTIILWWHSWWYILDTQW